LIEKQIAKGFGTYGFGTNRNPATTSIAVVVKPSDVLTDDEGEFDTSLAVPPGLGTSWNIGSISAVVDDAGCNKNALPENPLPHSSNMQGMTREMLAGFVNSKTLPKHPDFQKHVKRMNESIDTWKITCSPGERSAWDSEVDAMKEANKDKLKDVDFVTQAKLVNTWVAWDLSGKEKVNVKGPRAVQYDILAEGEAEAKWQTSAWNSQPWEDDWQESYPQGGDVTESYGIAGNEHDIGLDSSNATGEVDHNQWQTGQYVEAWNNDETAQDDNGYVEAWNNDETAQDDSGYVEAWNNDETVEAWDDNDQAEDWNNDETAETWEDDEGGEGDEDGW
jgi:hypothetical protein